MMIASVTLLALAIYAALAPAFAQQSDIRAIHKRMVQFHAAGNYAAALIEARKYEAAVKARLGTNHRGYAAALHNLAVVYEAQGQYGEAEGLHKRVLAILEKAKGASPLDVARSLLGLSNGYARKGQYGEAEGLYKRALAILEKAKGASHPDVAQVLLGLAGVYGVKGQYGEAEGLYKRALAILEKAKGRSHPDVSRPLIGLTGVYASKGPHGEADGLYKRALAILEKRAGQPDAANVMKVSLPPPEYIGTYKGLVIERVLPFVDVIRECGALGATTIFYACSSRSRPDPGIFCVIVIPSVDGYITSRIQELIRLHEIGHCLGWPADHPGARWEHSPQPKLHLGPQALKLAWSPAPPSPLRQSPAATLPAVAQRVVLYEEDPADPMGKRFIGAAIWQTETVATGAGQVPAVRCDIEIPDRRLAMTISMRRNTDEALRATHTIEMTFTLPADFPFGGVNIVPGLLMKEAETTRGAPLSGSVAKMTPTVFLLGLSAVESHAQRNVELLKGRSWLDIPVVYNNGRRAVIAVEKGNSGERAFNEAFAAWTMSSSERARSTSTDPTTQRVP
jgi:tetratricopeptide (TPR) repeat protein